MKKKSRRRFCLQPNRKPTVDRYQCQTNERASVNKSIAYTTNIDHMFFCGVQYDVWFIYYSNRVQIKIELLDSTIKNNKLIMCSYLVQKWPGKFIKSSAAADSERKFCCIVHCWMIYMSFGFWVLEHRSTIRGPIARVCVLFMWHFFFDCLRHERTTHMRHTVWAIIGAENEFIRHVEFCGRFNKFRCSSWILSHSSAGVCRAKCSKAIRLVIYLNLPNSFNQPTKKTTKHNNGIHNG